MEMNRRRQSAELSGSDQTHPAFAQQKSSLGCLRNPRVPISLCEWDDDFDPAGDRRRFYLAIAVTFDAVIRFPLGTACGRMGRNHPAASQECGIENSDHPQSRHT